MNPSIEKLQRATIDGGINYPNPQIYCDLFYIRSLFEYFKTRDELLPFNTRTYIIEYEAGRHLPKIFELKMLNNLPRLDFLSPFYKHAIEILKKYKITLPEMLKGKLRSIYRRIVASPDYPNVQSKQMNFMEPSAPKTRPKPQFLSLMSPRPGHSDSFVCQLYRSKKSLGCNQNNIEKDYELETGLSQSTISD